MKQVQEEQDLATRANASAPGLFTRSEDVPDPRFRFFCVECGAEIHGVPYLTAWYSICVCLDPYDFCSEACWNNNDLLNSANWPPPAYKRFTEKEGGFLV
jgi:hypothetical protein